MSGPRPIPGDPGAIDVWAIVNVDPGEWLLATAGHYAASAVETMANDGSGWQRCVAVIVPARRNHSTETETVRLMISAEDAVGLAAVMAHAALWLESL